MKIDWRRFALIALLFLSVPLAVIIGNSPAVQSIPYGPILVFCFVVILWCYISYCLQKPLKMSEELSEELSEEFKKIVTEMGLEETKKGTRTQIKGDYRKHHIEIQEVYHADDEGGGTWETRYYVEFENPQPILVSIGNRKWGFFPTAYLEEGKSIKMEDSEFDRRFLVRSNKESEIRAVLEQSIRNKIMNINNFNLTIGYADVKSLNELNSNSKAQNSDYVPKIQKSRIGRSMDRFLRRVGVGFVFVTNVAKHVDFHSLSKTKQDTKRFRAIIDTMVDIIEKIEAYASTARTATEYENEKLLQSATSVVVYCSKCGAANPVDSNFCPHCGNVIADKRTGES